MSNNILAAFGGSAYDSISGIIAQTMAFRLEGFECKEGDFYLSDENYELAKVIIGQLDAQTKKLREAYSEIEQSENVDSYFTNLTIDELIVADGCIRGFEMILNAQHHDMRRRILVSEASVMQAMRQIRRATAKLRKAIDDLMSIERQFQIASTEKYQMSFNMTSDKVAKLKAATEAVTIKL
ncbi:hypothetical protein AB6D04_05010 [Vibrio splendidus]|uniref:hypothetical protein n=1 Tax=Vibrio splendidus TaxID=29497 RepID=UPI000C84DE23|nr:hypothetical protein [Vibrio splendidus]PMN84809.1 hypothetical protein BCT24_02310 [Vibrio splendidus]